MKQFFQYLQVINEPTMKTKAILLVALTLVIGIFIGMLTSAHLRHQRMKSVRMYSSEQRFREGIYSSIKPDEEQKEKIDVILKKYSDLNRSVVSNFRKELESLMDQMRAEIEPLLSEEQLEQLRQREEEMKDMFRRGERPRPSDTLMDKPGFEMERRGGRHLSDSLRGVRFKQ